MTLLTALGLGICVLIALTLLKKGADPISPARLFGFTWSLSIALADLKLSALQHEWAPESWLLLMIGVGGFLVGTFAGFVLHMHVPLLPLAAMRERLQRFQVNEKKLYRAIVASVAMYLISYAVIYAVKGFLPIFAIGGKFSRMDFYVFGFGVLINSTAFIVYFTLLYHLYVGGKRGRKVLLVFLAAVSVVTYFLLVQRFQLIMMAFLCFTLLYYATRKVRFSTILIGVGSIAGVFFGIMTIRLGKLVATYTHQLSRMRFPKEYAALTEPYMYVVMNLENFAFASARADYHTYGYFTFDFVTALTGLKYWVLEYFNFSRMPYLYSPYNTYTGFFWLYSDFGVIGLGLIPLFLGLVVASLYYRMRSDPTLTRVTAYGIMVFSMVISFFNFPLVYLWYEFNVLALLLILRWVVIPPVGDATERA